jgi:hypothetical protein
VGTGLTRAAKQWARLLGLAGFAVGVTRSALTIREYALDKSPPAAARVLEVADHTLPELLDALDALPPEPLAVLKLEPPLAGVPLPSPPASGRQDIALRWLPLLPACDRPSRVGPDGTPREHELTRGLRAVLAAACRRQDGRLRRMVAALMRTAYGQAVGLDARGSKASLLRRGVLGQPVSPSGRAVVAPGGPLPLGLDTVGLPVPLFAAVQAGREASSAGAPTQAWIKRDPVLHRWGLLPVRCQPVPGDVIRLPASLLGPMGADFDGDTVAVFSRLPAVSADSAAVRPSALAWDALLDRPLFMPGKQYLYGLHLVMQSPGRRAALDEALRQVGAPTWPDRPAVKPALEEWVRLAAGSESDGAWWAILERQALDALADDPGMSLGLFDAGVLAALPVVACGAARCDSPERTAPLLAGRSLEAYGSGGPDPIAEVMAAARASVGLFGGVLRRLLCHTAELSPEVVRAAQALTEQATQRVLSVKAGKKPMPFGPYRRALRELLSGRPTASSGNAELDDLIKQLARAGIWERLRSALAGAPPPWLEWLREPFRLADVVRKAPRRTLRLPVQDVRVRSWFRFSEPEA